MSKKIISDNLDNAYEIDKYDDQHNQIKDSLNIVESTDSKTTDVVNFRIINTSNSYPFKNQNDDDKFSN